MLLSSISSALPVSNLWPKILKILKKIVSLEISGLSFGPPSRTSVSTIFCDWGFIHDPFQLPFPFHNLWQRRHIEMCQVYQGFQELYHISFICHIHLASFLQFIITVPPRYGKWFLYDVVSKSCTLMQFTSNRLKVPFFKWFFIFSRGWSQIN